jgi:hypothetical protein
MEKNIPDEGLGDKAYLREAVARKFSSAQKYLIRGLKLWPQRLRLGQKIIFR